MGVVKKVAIEAEIKVKLEMVIDRDGNGCKGGERCDDLGNAGSDGRGVEGS